LRARLPTSTPRREREHEKLQPVPKPSNGSRTVLRLDGPGTIIVQGNGANAPAISYDCGSCGSPLMVDVRRGQVTNVIMLCNNCGTYNEKR
jgi:hypothetical protein